MFLERERKKLYISHRNIYTYIRDQQLVYKFAAKNIKRGKGQKFEKVPDH